jgi:hypothetical protein
MRYRIRIKNKNGFHKWFAWYPVKAFDEDTDHDSRHTNLQIVWFEYVERRKVFLTSKKYKYFHRILPPS